MNNEIFLSIVIPIYNGASTIVRCLDSIWNQGLDEGCYEVVCVNDCSTDNTLDVLYKAKENRRNLRILSNSINKRAGGSRNYGVIEAKGRYIVFIDADDYFHRDSLVEVMRHLRDKNIDILMCDFARETERCPNNNIFLNFPNKNILSGHDFLLFNGCPFGPCKYVFKKDLMVKNSIYFEEYVCCEDVDWVHRLTLFANSVQYIPLLLSHVIINNFSQTANEHKNLRSISEKFFAGYRMYLLANQYKDDFEINKKLLGVAFVYYRQGIKYFTSVSTNIIDKTKVITTYLPPEITVLPKSIRYVQKFPKLYSIVTNLLAPLVAKFIVVKRKIRGR